MITTMTLTPDILYERKSLVSQVKKWKIIALIFVFLTIITVKTNTLKSPSSSPYIARVTLEDIILENTNKIEKIKKLASNDAVKAVIFRINSPGGTSYGGEQLYSAIRFIAKKKPTVAIIGTLGASGAYMGAIAADYLLAGKTSLTGSIGVIMQSFDTRGLLTDKLGIVPYSFKSSNLKAVPSPFEEVTPAVKAAIDYTIRDTYEVFKKMVQERRKFSDEELSLVSDGRVFTGLQAKELKLIDDIGQEDEALDWLMINKNIAINTEIKDYRIDDKSKIIEELLGIESFKSYIFSLLSTKLSLTIW